jgi:MFS family permease
VTQTPAGPAAPPASYSALFRVREYRALVTADVFSLLGDQLAAVAMAVLVYERSHSAFLAALAYTTIFLPWVVGGPWLSALADRLPCRRVLVGVDLIRAALIGAASLPRMPLAAVCALLLASAMLSPPFRSSRAALVPQVLPDDRYPVALSLQDGLTQSSQLIGFVAGGALVSVFSARGALALDALSFIASGLLLLRGLTARPPALPKDRRTSLRAETWEGMRLVVADTRLRRPLQLAMVSAMYIVVAEAIAPSYAASLGGGAATVGLIMGVVAGGSVIGSVVMARFVPPPARQRLLKPICFAGTVPLMMCGLTSNRPASLALLLLVGASAAVQVPANAAFAAAVPAHARARAFGVAMMGLMAAQLVGVVIAGAAAQWIDANLVAAGAGLIGCATLLAVVFEERVGSVAVRTPGRRPAMSATSWS